MSYFVVCSYRQIFQTKTQSTNTMYYITLGICSHAKTKLNMLNAYCTITAYAVYYISLVSMRLRVILDDLSKAISSE